MKVLEYRGTFAIGEKKRLIFITDLHWGHCLCCERKYKQVIADLAQQDDVIIVFDGDMFDSIVSMTNDKRFNPAEIAPRYLTTKTPVDLAVDELVEVHEPVADKIGAWGKGNHELTLLKKTGTDVARRIMAGLYGKEGDKKLFGYTGFLQMFFTHKTSGGNTRRLIAFISHGPTSSARLEGGHLSRLGCVAKSYGGDIHAFGHVHQLESWENVVVEPAKSGNRLVHKDQLRIVCGSWVKGYSDDDSVTYVEQRAFKPNQLGYMEVEVEFLRSGLEQTTRLTPIKRKI